MSARSTIHLIYVMQAASARSIIGGTRLDSQIGRRTLRLLVSVQLTSSGATGAERVSPALDYVERLRRLAANDAHLAEAGAGGAGVESGELDPKRWRSSVSPRLVAVGGAVPSYEAQADAAVSAGATAAEIIGVLAEVVPIVGFPCVVAVAPKLAMALGAELPLPVPLCLLGNGSG